MLVKKCKMPEIKVDKRVIVPFTLMSLVGSFDKKSAKYFSIIARLIDKARNEYMETRLYVIEATDHKNVNKDPLTYAVEIINHSENCINALARIYKIFNYINKNYQPTSNIKVNSIRNRIEHMDEDIYENKKGSTSLNISKNATSLEISNKSLDLVDLAKEIENLHEEILELFNKNSKI